jgi:Glyoxalase-like domain
MSDSDDESKKSNEDASAEDDEMQKLLAGFVDEIGDDDDDDESSSSSSDSSGPELREIDLPDNVLDHVVLAAPELEPAMIEFQEKTGIEPRISGSIKGLGIKTARVSFEGDSFLEIIAPDPEKGGPIGNLLRASGLQGLVPFHWAIRHTETGDLTGPFKKLGYTPDCISMFGARADGTPRKWELLYLYGHKLKGMCPFFINWDKSDHPCQSAPIVGDLIHVKVTAPGDDLIHKLIAETGSSGFELEEGAAKFEIKFDSPEGEVVFTANKMIGFRFPGFEDECGPIEGEEDEDGVPDFAMPEMPEMLEVGNLEDYDNSATDLGEPPEISMPAMDESEIGLPDDTEEAEEGGDGDGEKKKKKKKDKEKKEKKEKKSKSSDGEKKKKKKKDKKKDKEESEAGEEGGEEG